MPIETEIILAGVPEFKRALKQAAPEYLKQMNAEIRGIGTALARGAAALIPDKPPMSGWLTTPPREGVTRNGQGWPVWNPAIARKKITFVQGGSRKSQRMWYTQYKAAYSLKNDDAAGIIFDWAGKADNNGQFVKNIRNTSHSNRWRVLVRYLGTRQAKETAQKAIAAAIKRAENRMQGKL